MNFNRNSNQALESNESSEPTDYGRLVAATRIKTMAPINDGVKANERSDEYIAAQDVLNGPIANISIDSEQTIAEGGNASALPLAEHHHAAGLIVGGIFALMLAAAFVFVFFVK